MTTLPNAQNQGGSLDSTVPRTGNSPQNFRPYLVGTAKRRVTGSLQMALDLLPHETEDTRITGGTRSLVRRLMALNVGGSLCKGKTAGTNAPLRVASKIA